ncbi:hypothetical protein Q1695_004429 [Nippostrongylus brasiliensis]|nr:hypothetical protein Q1695_004429 [Nippostrongylus brasiliensis]
MPSSLFIVDGVTFAMRKRHCAASWRKMRIEVAGVTFEKHGLKFKGYFRKVIDLVARILFLIVRDVVIEGLDSSSVCVVKCDAPGPAKDPGDEMTTSTDAVDNVKKPSTEAFGEKLEASDYDDLLLKTNAPMPKPKTRPRLRPLTVMDLIEKLESNDMDGISIDLLSSLLKYFPTDEESRTLVKMRSSSIMSGRQLAGRERFSMQRRSLQPSRPGVEAMVQMFLSANQ